MSDSAPSLETLERPSPLFKHFAKVKLTHLSNAGFEVVFELTRSIFDWPRQRHVLKLDRQKLQVCSRVQRKPAAQGQTGNAEGYRQPPGGSTRRKREPSENPMKSAVFDGSQFRSMALVRFLRPKSGVQGETHVRFAVREVDEIRMNQLDDMSAGVCAKGFTPTTIRTSESTAALFG